jgi:hypothetical protein
MIIRRGQAPWSTDMHLDRKSGCAVLLFLPYAVESEGGGNERNYGKKSQVIRSLSPTPEGVIAAVAPLCLPNRLIAEAATVACERLLDLPHPTD